MSEEAWVGDVPAVVLGNRVSDREASLYFGRFRAPEGPWVERGVVISATVR